MSDGLVLAVAGVIAVFVVMLVLMGVVALLRWLGQARAEVASSAAASLPAPADRDEVGGAEVALLAVALYCSGPGSLVVLPEVSRRELSLWRRGGK